MARLGIPGHDRRPRITAGELKPYQPQVEVPLFFLVPVTIEAMGRKIGRISASNVNAFASGAVSSGVAAGGLALSAALESPRSAKQIISTQTRVVRDLLVHHKGPRMEGVIGPQTASFQTGRLGICAGPSPIIGFGAREKQELWLCQVSPPAASFSRPRSGGSASTC